jgi:hypothetical protein
MTTELENSLSYGTKLYYNETLYDEKGRSFFIKQCVSLIRKCEEYKRYRNFLIDNMSLNTCSILSKLSEEEVQIAGLELHHAPLTLYDCVELVLGKILYENERLTTFSVANQVMAYHWRGLIGLVPLTQVLHEAVHAGQLTLDPRLIFGNWQKFIEENQVGLTDSIVAKIQATILSWDSDEVKVQNNFALTVNLQQWIDNPITLDHLLTKENYE